MAKSTYYVEIGKIDAVKRRNQALADRIQAVFIHHNQCYGVQRVHQELVRLGYMVNHKRVQRLMHQLNFYTQQKRMPHDMRFHHSLLL